MKYTKQIVVLNMHVNRLREQYNILIQLKSIATKSEVVGLNASLGAIQDEIGNTISAIGILNGLV